MIELRTLGTLDLRRRGGPELLSVLSQPKRAALLCYLALARPRGFRRRDTILPLFWPEADAEHARWSLRQSIHRLRESLGDEAILSRGDEDLGLATDVVWCDAVSFEAALDAGEGDRALALYAGDLLPGLYVDGAPGFERWLEAERRRLHERAVRGAWALAEAREAEGDAAGAAEWGRRALELAPADEALLRSYMELLVRTGDAARADEAYRGYARRLHDEYELVPSADARTLAERIRDDAGLRQGAPAGVAPEASPPAAMHQASPPAAAAGATPPQTGEGSTVPAPKPARRVAAVLRRHQTRAVASLLVLLALALGAWVTMRRLGIGPVGSLLSAGAIRPRDRIVLADFRNLSEDRDLGTVVTEALRIDLQQSNVVSVVTPERIADALRRMTRSPDAPLDAPTARAIALRDGYKAVLSGEVATVGPAYVLAAQLTAAGSDEPLASFRENARNAGELIDAIGRLSRRVRARIGESLRGLREEPPLSAVTTPSLEALRKFTLAGRMSTTYGRTPVEGDRRAVALFEEAVALDTAFAAAYRALGNLLYNMNQTTRGLEALSQAYRFRDRLPESEREATIGTYARRVLRDRPKAIAAFSRVLEMGSEERTAVALEHLGEMYQEEGKYSQAEEMWRRRLAVDSAAGRQSLPYLHRGLIQALLGQGRLREVEAAIGEMTTRDVDNPVTWNFAINARYASGDLAGAEAAIRELRARFGDRQGRRIAAYNSAYLAALRGRPRQATGLMADAVANSGPPATQLFAVAPGYWDLLLRGDSAGAAAVVEEALRRWPIANLPPFDRPYNRTATLLALAGRPERARQLLAGAPRPSAATERLNEMNQYVARGAIALAEHRPPEAIAAFRAFDREAGCPACSLALVGQAFEEASQPDSAIDAYRAYVDSPSLWRLERDTYYLVPVLERLGGLYERRGQREDAARCWARVLSLWSDPEPELRPQVQAAREHLARLTSEPRAGS